MLPNWFTAKYGNAAPPPVEVPSAADFSASLAAPAPAAQPLGAGMTAANIYEPGVFGTPLHDGAPVVNPETPFAGGGVGAMNPAANPDAVKIAPPPGYKGGYKSTPAGLTTEDGKFLFQSSGKVGEGSWVPSDAVHGGGAQVKTVPAVEDLGNDPGGADAAAKAAHAKMAGGAVEDLGNDPGPPAAGGGGAPSGAGGGMPSAGGSSGAKPWDLTPGEKAMLSAGKDTQQWDEIWGSAIADKHAEGAAAATDIYGKGIAEQEKLLAKERVESEKFEKWAAEDHAKRAALADEIRNTKLDENKLFNDMGLGGALAVGLGLVLGALGAPATGGKNGAVEVIDKAVERNLRVQQANYENKRASLKDSQNEYAMRVKMFGDEKIARATVRADSWRMVAMHVEQKIAETKVEEDKLHLIQVHDHYDNKAKEADAAVEMEIERRKAMYLASMQKGLASQQAKADKYADKIMEVELAGAKKVVEEYPGAQVVVDGNHVKVVDPTTGKQIWEGGGGGAGKVPTVTIPGAMNNAGEWSAGGTAVAHSPEAATKYQTITLAAKDGLKAVQILKKIREKNSGGEWIPSSQDEADADFAVRTLFKADKTVGENSDKDAERIQVNLPDVFKKDAKAWIMGGAAKPDAMIKQWEEKFNNDVKNANGTYLKKPAAAGPAPLPLTAAPKK